MMYHQGRDRCWVWYAPTDRSGILEWRPMASRSREGLILRQNKCMVKRTGGMYMTKPGVGRFGVHGGQ